MVCLYGCDTYKNHSFVYAQYFHFSLGQTGIKGISLLLEMLQHVGSLSEHRQFIKDKNDCPSKNAK